ncbi:MAG TPA: IS4 family transposase, partial [Ignavibacteriaceae bacterium]
EVIRTFYEEAPYHTWYDMRLLAVDASRLVLPKHQSIADEFGEYGLGCNADCKRSLSLTSFLYDPLNLLILDAQMAPYGSSERQLLSEHLGKVNPGDLLIMDRGYPSIPLMFQMQARKIEFCIRMKEDWWLSVKDFSESGEKERIVKFQIPKKSHEVRRTHPEFIDQEITCRLICVTLENGEKEILCTSLTDMEKYPHKDFCELYHFRWNVEEGFKLFKARAEVERFSGKTTLAVKQDFFAKVFMMSLCAVMAFPIDEKIKKESKEAATKHSKKINRTTALANTRDIAIGVFIKRLIKTAIAAFDKLMKRTTEIIRPGRKNPRNKKTKRPYYMNYKPL